MPRRPKGVAAKSLLDERLNRRFQVIGGKGGVGRSSVAIALAMRAARLGQRSLILEVAPSEGVFERLGRRPAFNDPVLIADRLWVCRMTPEHAMSEYALMVLRFKALYNLVFENRLVRYMLHSIPSLGEFTMLGKVWHHATERLTTGEPRFDRVFVDLPATGHAITFLSVARVVAEVSPPGRMKEAAGLMADLVESKTDSCMHVVTLAEEMPVNEALDLCAMAQNRVGIPLGLGIVNRLLPPLLREGQEAVEAELLKSRDPKLRPYAEIAGRRVAREALQSIHLERFLRVSGLPWIGLLEEEAPAKPEAWFDHLDPRSDPLSEEGSQSG